MLIDLLVWLDRVPHRYWTLAWLLFSLVCLSAIAPSIFPNQRYLSNRSLFAGLLLLSFLTFRFPFVCINAQGPNPDESQILAGAITLTHDPLFWRSVDGTTHGPLVQWPIAFLGACGATIDYSTGRLCSIVVTWLGLMAAWRALSFVINEARARLAILPTFCFLAFSHFWDFCQVSSEHVPAAMIPVAVWLLLKGGGLPNSPLQRVWLAVAGLVLGAIPFAKLQAGPIVGSLTGFALVSILLLHPDAKRRRWIASGSLIAGTVTFPCLLLTITAIKGQWIHFWRSYILDNIFYTSQRSANWSESFTLLFKLSRESEIHDYFLYPSLILVIWGLVIKTQRSRPDWIYLLFSSIMVAAAAFCIVAPGRPYAHYIQFLSFPLTFLIGSSARSILPGCEATKDRLPAEKSRGRAWTLVWILIGVAPLIGWRIRASNPYIGSATHTRAQALNTPISVFLKQHANANDKISIWGWMPRFYVESGLSQATRESHTYRQIEESPLLDYYKERYLADIKLNQPLFFLDAVGPKNFNYQDRNRYGHENFPSLSAWIAGNYELVADDFGTRIYMRYDRIPRQ